jgi:hypothetical protein
MPNALLVLSDGYRAQLKPSGLQLFALPVSESPAVIEIEVQSHSTDDAEDIRSQIVKTSPLGQSPQETEIDKHGGTGGYMVLQHSLKVLLPAPLTPITPGPQIVKQVVADERNLDGYDAGEKIIQSHSISQKPEEKHVDYKSPGSD